MTARQVNILTAVNVKAVKRHLERFTVKMVRQSVPTVQIQTVDTAVSLVHEPHHLLPC